MVERCEYLAEEMWTAWHLQSKRSLLDKEDRSYLWSERYTAHKEFIELRDKAYETDRSAWKKITDIILPRNGTVSI